MKWFYFRAVIFIMCFLIVGCSGPTKKETTKLTMERNPDLFADYIKTGDIPNVEKYMSSFDRFDLNMECVKSKEKMPCLELAVVNKQPELIDFIFVKFGEEKTNIYLNDVLDDLLTNRDIPTIDYIFKEYGVNKVEPLKKLISDGDLVLLQHIFKYYDQNFPEKDSLLSFAEEYGDRAIVGLLAQKFNNGVVPVVTVWNNEDDLQQEMDLDNNKTMESVKITSTLAPEKYEEDGMMFVANSGEIILDIEGHTKKLVDDGDTVIYFEDMNKDGIVEIIHNTGHRTYYQFDIYHYTNAGIERIGNGEGTIESFENGNIKLPSGNLLSYENIVNNFVLTDQDEGYYDADEPVDNAAQGDKQYYNQPAHISNFLTKTTGVQVGLELDIYGLEGSDNYVYHINDKMKIVVLTDMNTAILQSIILAGSWSNGIEEYELDLWHRYSELLIDYFEDEEFDSVINQILNGTGNVRKAYVDNKVYTMSLQQNFGYYLSISIE